MLRERIALSCLITGAALLAIVIAPSISFALTNQAKAAVGIKHSVVVLEDGAVRAWGSNDLGQLGDGTNIDRDFPIKVTGISNVISVAAGAFYTVALTADGSVFAWGDNSRGQLGNGGTVSSNVPIKVEGVSGVVAVVAGFSHTLALTDDGTVFAWGQNSDGQLGNGTRVDSHVPVRVMNISGAVDIAAGNNHSYALLLDGTAWMWGFNVHSPLVTADDKWVLMPRQINSWDDKFTHTRTPIKVETPTAGGATVYVVNGTDNTLFLQPDGNVLIKGMDPLTQDTSSGAPVQIDWRVGALKVDIAPSEAIETGVRWRVDGGEWIIGGETVSGLAEGLHTVEFSEYGGWNTPPNMSVAISEGQVTVASATYTPRTAPLTVNLGPPDAVSSGAAWRVDGAEWIYGAQAVLEIAMGDHVVEFLDVSGWVTPQPSTVTLDANGAALTFAYGAENGKNSGNGDAVVSEPEPVLMTVGSSVSGSIGAAGDVARYNFDAVGGSRYLLEVQGLEWGYIKIYSPDGVTKLAESSPGSQAGLVWVAPSSGIFKIEISSSNVSATGSFNATVSRRPGVMDFNNDGESDILWRNMDSGRTFIWFMDGAKVINSGDTSASAGDPGGWKIKGLGDFSGDGMTDILWRHAGSGKTAIWFMNGRVLTGGTGLTSVQIPASSAWRIKSVDDFDGDGRTDILWRHGDTGKTAIWFLDGLELTGKSALTSVQVSAGSMWEIEDTGDFDGDGRADILWRHAGSGLTAIWFMDGVTMLDGSALTTLQVEGGANGWAVRDVGDFNGDGRADILWRRAGSGLTAIWFMDGVDVASESGYTSTIVGAGSPWRIAGVGDYNGDGRADIMWQKGEYAKAFVWLMNGVEIMAGSEEAQGGYSCAEGEDCAHSSFYANGIDRSGK